jgi:hypothetical protein
LRALVLDLDQAAFVGPAGAQARTPRDPQAERRERRRFGRDGFFRKRRQGRRAFAFQRIDPQIEAGRRDQRREFIRRRRTEAGLELRPQPLRAFARDPGRLRRVGQVLARQSREQRALPVIEPGRSIDAAVKQPGQLLGPAALDQDQRGEDDAARPARLVARPRFHPAQPPVKPRPRPQGGVDKVTDRAPVLGAHIAPLAKIRGHDPLGGDRRRLDAVQQLDRSLYAGARNHGVLPVKSSRAPLAAQNPY